MGQIMMFRITAAFVVMASAAVAGPIEGACNKSDRQSANSATCDCIQQVADATLSSGDQRRVAKFFNNPDKAHKVWTSKNGGDDAFWDRYKNFGEAAKAYCSPS
jgi:hypothetical protein